MNDSMGLIPCSQLPKTSSSRKKKKKKKKKKKFQKTTSAAASFNIIHPLNHNLLLEILIRLPAKFAHRYKCVSKLWNSVISSPYFARKFIHLRQFNTNLRFTFIFNDTYIGHDRNTKICIATNSKAFKSSRFSLSFLNTPYHHVIGSYNDLLLVIYSYSNSVYCICNPITKQFVVLPPVSHRYDNRQLYVNGFICDPISEQVGEGRTVINTTKYKYAIVFIVDINYSSNTLKLQIFSSENNEWKESDVSFPRGFVISHWDKFDVVYNRILYRLCTEKYIFAYDVFGTYGGDDVNRCRFIDLPSDFHPNAANSCLGVCQARLRLSQLLQYNLIVWELNNDSHKWYMKHNILFNTMTASKNPKLVQLLIGPRTSRMLVGFHTNDVDIVYLHLGKLIVSCNLRYMTLKFVRYGINHLAATNVFLLARPQWPTPIPANLPLTVFP